MSFSRHFMCLFNVICQPYYSQLCNAVSVSPCSHNMQPIHSSALCDVNGPLKEMMLNHESSNF